MRTNNRRGVWLLPAIALAEFALDQASKYSISTSLAFNESWNPIPELYPYIRLTHWRNSGSAFGMFPELGGAFLVVATAVTVGIIYYARSLNSDSPLLLRVSLGLMLGGALGNLIDRVRFGYVVDFVNLGWWPVFNFADSAIVIGVLLLAWHLSRAQPIVQDVSATAASEPGLQEMSGN